MGRKNTECLAKSDYPLYCSRMIGEKHLLVGGGGGKSASGVPNAMDIYELQYKEGVLTLHRVNHYETKSRAVMNCDVASHDKCFYLATGMDDSCSVHILRYKVMVPKVEKEVLEGVRKRKNNFTNSTNHNMAPRMVGFEIEPIDEVVTDKAAGDAYQKVVRFSQDIGCFATGGNDGILRCWEFPSLKLLYEVQSHTNVIDELDCSPDNKYVVTISKDNSAMVWKLKDGSKHVQLIGGKEPLKAHRFRNCRFAGAKESGYCLLTTHIPIAKAGGRIYNFIAKWEGENFRCVKLVNVGSSVFANIAVSRDGKYLGVGYVDGAVSVYNTSALQRIYHTSSAHTGSVTGLEFVPMVSEIGKVSKAHDFTMFTISFDRLIVAHQVENEAGFCFVRLFLGFSLLIFLAAWFFNVSDLLAINNYLHQ